MLRFQHSPVSGFPLRASIAVCLTPFFPPVGTFGASRVLRHISSCMPRPVDSGGPSHPSHLRMLLCCLRRSLKPSTSAKTSSRSCTSTSGCAITPTAYRILCLRFTCFVRQLPCRLHHRRKTRYGRVTNPYPTGTFTPKDMPSFPRRDNAELRSVENAPAFSTSSSSEMLAAAAAFPSLTFSFLLAFPLWLFLRCNQFHLFPVLSDYLFP